MHLDWILFGRGGDDDDGGDVDDDGDGDGDDDGDVDDDGDNNVKSQNDTGIRRNKTHEDGDDDGYW